MKSETKTDCVRPALFSTEPDKESAPGAEAFITKETVAERLCVTPETVGRWANTGRLPSHRFGRRLRFKWSEVERALVNRPRISGPTVLPLSDAGRKP